jgi:6-phosphogluconolactonase
MERAIFAVGGTPTPAGRGGLEIFAVLPPEGDADEAFLTKLGSADVGSVGYMATSRASRTLYVASQLGAEAQLSAFRWSVRGTLERLSRERLSAGAGHLCVADDGEHLLTTEYGEGSVSLFRIVDGGGLTKIDEFRFEGSGPHPRQDAPHPHQVISVGDSYVVPDLGTDLVHQFVISDEGKLEHRHQWSVPAGSGPRHAVGAQRTLFVACELSGEVRWGPMDGGESFDGVVRSSASTAEEIMPSAIGIHEERLYVANRGPGTILSALASPGGLSDLDEFASGGTWPRDFDLVGDYVAIADLRDDRLRLVRARAPYVIAAEAPVSGPSCVVAL